MAVRECVRCYVPEWEIECELWRQTGEDGLCSILHRDGEGGCESCIVRLCDSCLMEPAGMVVLRACTSGTFWPWRFQEFAVPADPEPSLRG